jgi:hypothetical protein
MMEVPESSISKKVFNGKEYYFVETTYATEMYGMNFSSKVNLAVHIEDGWCYMFYFYGESNNPRYDEFVQLVKSVEYGDVGTPGAGGGWMIATVVVVIILGAIIIRKKKTQQKGTAATETTVVRAVSQTQQEYIFCHQCGNKLPADSMFCNVCGTRLIEKEDNQ